MFAEVFCLLLVSTTIFGLPVYYDAPQEDVSQWNDYVEEHDKVYESPEEEMRRFEIFRENMKKAERQNEEHGGMATFGATVFSDLTDGEYSEMFHEEQRTFYDEQQADEAIEEDLCWLNSSKPLSVYKNWSNFTKHIKNQRNCGSCYIFSVLGAIDAHRAIYEHDDADLSEQEVLDCGSEGEEFTCRGGNRLMIYRYAEFKGLVNESDYLDYRADKDSCLKIEASRFRIKGHCNLPQDEDKIALAIDQVGPVSVGVFWNHEFRNYKNGTLNPKECRNDTTNHAVLAVGYGEQNGQKYWLIKNSHGGRWGDHGYFRIVRGENKCGIARFANYPIV